MKLSVEVLAVETDGDNLRIKTQGRAARWAPWRRYVDPVLVVPDTLPNRKAFYVGRWIGVEVTPL